MSAVVKEYEKKLAHDPHNVEALSELGAVYYDDGNWDKVWGIYKTLFDLSSAHTEIDVAEVTRKWGIAGYNLKKYDEAINALMFSVKKDPNAYETNFFLGASLMEKQVFDKAAYCFKKCKLIAPENTDVSKFLGLCLFKSQKYRDSLAHLKKALDV
jgi:tetratricopeptide (TPR) repeat protein